MTSTRKILIDKNEYELNQDLTIIQACEIVGIQIPRFCYHERLSIAGNCRMCLVEVVGGPPKPTASCSIQLKDLRPGPNGEAPNILTNSEMVVKARKGVMEFLLINHPLDCPICDQGGECDLQDQAMHFGLGSSRYKEEKRTMDDFDLGPLVETHMTRCISCTRCVRFTTEIAGIDQMGQTGRGEDSEIVSYLNQTLHSELQGNIIDLCPVGALTSKPYAFTARPWELKKTETIDVMDGVGSNIRVDSKGNRIMRIIPIENHSVNEEWISDKTRFVWDGVRVQRLDVPYKRIEGKLVTTSWEDALRIAKEKIMSLKTTFVAGDLSSVETLFSAKILADQLNSYKITEETDLNISFKNRSAYVGNSKIQDIDEVENIVLLGVNPRVEASVVNARIRKAWLKGAKVFRLGKPDPLTYSVSEIGDNFNNLQSFLERFENKNSFWRKALIIIGYGFLSNRYVDPAFNSIRWVVEHKKAKLLMLHPNASSVGALDLGFGEETNYQKLISESDVFYKIGADDVTVPPEKYVIYQGSHGDKGASKADLILPSACYLEEEGLFVNTEGRVQLSKKAINPPGEARENWKIIRALLSECSLNVNWNSMYQLRKEIFNSFPIFSNSGTQTKSALEKPNKPVKLKSKDIINCYKKDFYLSNVICRASSTMAELSKIRNNNILLDKVG